MRWSARIESFALRRAGDFPGAALNDQLEAVGIPAGVDGAERLRQAANILKAEAFDAASGRMDYGGLRDNRAYLNLRGLTAGLRAFNIQTLQGWDQQAAFWINLYSTLMVDAVIHSGVRKSVNAVRGLFWRAAYRIGGQRFSLMDIEHDILRANAGHPAIPGGHFDARDPRRKLCLPAIDARIHFALNCASRSCPPIAWYRADRLSPELDLATASFLQSGGLQCDLERQVVWLSRLFRWHAPDSGGRTLAVGPTQRLLQFAARYLEPGPVRDLLQCEQPRVRFLPYDWSLNG